MAHRSAPIEVEDTRLDPRDASQGVDLDDPVQLCRDDQDRAPDRRGVVGETGATLACDEPPVMTHGDAHRARLLRSIREAHDRGVPALVAGVARVRRQPEWLRAGAVFSKD